MLVPFRQLLGAEPDSTELLLDYRYRAAWKVTAGGETYLIKADERAGLARGEAEANKHAAAHGIPVAEFVALVEAPVPATAFRWVAGVSLHGLATADAWRAAGRVLRLIHELPVLREREPLAPVTWFSDELGWMVEQGALTVGEAQSALAVAHRLDPVIRASPRAWTHGDCQAAHFIMDEFSHRVVAVIDWADAQSWHPEMDFAVLTLFDEGVLPWLLEGYEAGPAFRERLALTLPFFQAVRAAGSYRWLETHGYAGHTWPIERVRALISG